jgi:hypothetical protein
VGASSDSPPVITLTTDFGLRDPFVGIMKGVILGICPEARLVDLSHEIAPQDVLEAQLALEAAAGFFPAGSVHLAVVDPGVGSRRRALALRAGVNYFVGPDNGLFTFALATGNWSAVALEAPQYRLAEVSRTFHGRDVFAPAAAHLALGVPLASFGPPVQDPVRLEVPVARLEGRHLLGEVIGADRFGNLITSVMGCHLRGDLEGGWVEVAGTSLGPPVDAYAEGPDGAPAAIIGSSGRLEIFVRNGSARRILGVERGASVRVCPAGDPGSPVLFTNACSTC